MALAEFGMADSHACPTAFRWMEIYSRKSQWSPEESAHMSTCKKCAGLARQYEAAARSKPWWRRLISRNSIWIIIASVIFAMLPFIGIRAAGEFLGSYDLSVGMTHWVSTVRDHIFQIGAIAGGSLAAVGLPFVYVLRKVDSSRSAISVLTIGMLSVVAGTFQTQQSLTQSATEEIINREALFQSTRWILLDSVFFWPDDLNAVRATGHPGQRPTRDQMMLELETLKSGGFSGIYVFGDPQPELLKLADQMGFAVIQGITVHDPQNFKSERTQDEVRAAIASADFVDAFVLGNLRASNVDMAGLQDELAKLRQRTGKPVTPNFMLSDYLDEHGITANGRKLLSLSDFMISDLPRPYRHEPAQGNPEEAAAAVARALNELNDVGVPAILSLVGYPSKNGEGFTEENQRRFIELVLKIDRRQGMGIAYTNGFDLPWKQKLSKVSPFTKECDGNLGFFRTTMSEDESTATFTPKPAIEEFRKYDSK